MSEIICPSGLKLEIRGLKGKEISLLQDKASVRSGTFIDKMLTACTQRVLEPGPYQIESGGPIDWDRILLGDKFFVLLSVRAETFGDEFGFKTKCGGCGHRFEWSVKLSQMPIKMLGEEDAAAFKAGKPLTAALDGRRVEFRLATGKDERTVGQAKTAENALVAMMALRISSIEGVENVREFLEDCSLGDLTRVLKEFDRRDCGVDTSIEVTCDDCGGAH